MNAISDRLPLALLGGSEPRTTPERSVSGRRPSAPISDRVLAKALRGQTVIGEGLLHRKISKELAVRATPSITRGQMLNGAVSGMLMAGCICPVLLMLSFAEQYELFLVLTIGVMLVSGIWGIGRELLLVQLGFAKPRPARLIEALILMAGCAVVLHV